MDFYTIILAIIIVAIIALTFSFVKNIFKAIMLSLTILGLILGVASYFVYKDAMDLKENFMKEEKLVLLSDGEKNMAAFSIGEFTDFESFTPIDENDVNLSSESYYKILIFNLSAFDENLEDGLQVGDGEQKMNLTGSEIKNTLYSKDPIEAFFQNMINKNSIPPSESQKNTLKAEAIRELGLRSEDDFKSFLLFALIIDMFRDEGPISIINRYQSDELKILPETALFKALNFIPGKVAKTVGESVASGDGEQI